MRRLAEVIAGTSGVSGQSGSGNKIPPQTVKSPLQICSWATAEEVSDGVQRLGIDMSPRSIPVPKTRAATGCSLLTNGFMGADLLQIPAGEGFAPHIHPGDHLLFVLGGEGTITINGVIQPTGPGQAYMVDGASRMRWGQLLIMSSSR